MLAKEEIAKLTAELDALKAKYEDADVSSTVVENMLDTQLKFSTKKDLGYNHIPPPFNHNYTPPLETSKLKSFVYVGKPLENEPTVSDKSSNSDSVPVEVTNVSASCAGTPLKF